MTPLIDFIVMLILAVAAPSVLWFFRVRKTMIARQKLVIDVLEGLFKPREKLYTLLGYLVGFKAVYVLGGRSKATKAWIMYVTPPSHVFFYLPLIILAGEKERLELTLKARGSLPYTAHIFLKNDRWSRRTLSQDYGKSILKNCKVLPSAVFYYSCGSSSAVAWLSSLAAKVKSKTGIVVARASIDSSKNVFHVSLILERLSIYDAVKIIIEEFNRIVVT